MFSISFIKQPVENENVETCQNLFTFFIKAQIIYTVQDGV